MSSIPPIQPPLRVQPLPAMPVARPQRPAWATWIGVGSIIVSVISIGTAIAWVLWAMVLYMSSQFTVARNTATMVPVAPQYSLTDAQRATVINGLGQLQMINPRRSAVLDALLAQHGRDMIPMAGGNPPPETIARSVSDHGTMPSAGGEPSQFFVVGNGRIELYDTHALFRPSDGGDALRATEEDVLVNLLPSGLRPADVKAAIAHLNRLTTNGLSTEQESALRKILSTPGQRLLIAGGQAIESQIYYAAIQGDGVLTVYSSGGSTVINKDGTIVDTNPTAGRGARAASGLPASLATLSGVIHLLLAVLLMIAGILTLRQSFKARMIHLIYVILKLLFSIAGVVILKWVWDQYMGSSTNPQTVVTLMLIWMMAFLYPLTLLVVLNLPGVRAYYRRA